MRGWIFSFRACNRMCVLQREDCAHDPAAIACTLGCCLERYSWFSLRAPGSSATWLMRPNSAQFTDIGYGRAHSAVSK